jgi:hypothetical protein
MAYENNAVQPLPQLSNSGWLYWPKARTIILALAILQFVISIPLGVAPISLVIAAVMVLLIWKSPNNRQFVYQVFEQFYADRKEKRHARKRGPYRTKALREVIYFDGDVKTTKPLEGPVEPGFIPLEGGKSGFLTEIRTMATGEHTLYVILDGYGAAGSGDPDDLRAANQSLVEALKEIGNEYGPGLSVSLSFARVPTNPTEALEYVERRLAETDSELGRQLADNIAEAMANQIDMSGDTFLAIAIRAPRPRSWNKAKSPSEIQTHEILQAPAYKLSEILIQRLRSMGADRPRRPTPFEAITFIHGTLDPTTIEHLYLDAYADNKRMETGELETFEESVLMKRGILPPDWQPEPTFLRIGDTYCRMFFVPEYPDPFVEAGLMRELVHAPEDIWYGISYAYETQNVGTEMKRTRFRHNEGDSRRLERATSGRSATAADEDREMLESQHERIQYYSRGGVIKLNTLAWVNSASLEGLNEAEVRLARIFRGVGLSLQRVPGQSLQVQVRLMAYNIKSEKV